MFLINIGGGSYIKMVVASVLGGGGRACGSSPKSHGTLNMTERYDKRGEVVSPGPRSHSNGMRS